MSKQRCWFQWSRCYPHSLCQRPGCHGTQRRQGRHWSGKLLGIQADLETRTRKERGNGFSRDSRYLFFFCMCALLSCTCLCHSIRDSSLPRWLQFWITKPRHCETLLYVKFLKKKKKKKKCPNRRVLKLINKTTTNGLQTTACTQES